MDEEVILLEEQLAAANADIESLQTQLAETAARASEVGDLRRQLDTAQRSLKQGQEAFAGQAQQLDALGSELAEARQQASLGAARYREALLAREPDLPSDLVSGDNVEAIEQSLATARETVSQVRQHLEQQAQTLRVPNGAPARSTPDPAELSPAEKIRLGLQQS